MTFPTYEYEGVRRVVYGEDGATFVPVCETCGRFVKADDAIITRQDGGWARLDNRNATCSKCGRTYMVFEGFYG
jgi:hypothetical protein